MQTTQMIIHSKMLYAKIGTYEGKKYLYEFSKSKPEDSQYMYNEALNCACSITSSNIPDVSGKTLYYDIATKQGWKLTNNE